MIIAAFNHFLNLCRREKWISNQRKDFPKRNWITGFEETTPRITPSGMICWPIWNNRALQNGLVTLRAEMLWDCIWRPIANLLDNFWKDWNYRKESFLETKLAWMPALDRGNQLHEELPPSKKSGLALPRMAENEQSAPSDGSDDSHPLVLVG